MKQGIHPDNYRVVVFKDMSDGTQFFSRSTAATKDTIEIDGVQRVTRSTPVSPNSWTPQVVWTNLCLATAIATASNAGRYKGGQVCPPLLFV